MKKKISCLSDEVRCFTQSQPTPWRRRECSRAMACISVDFTSFRFISCMDSQEGIGYVSLGFIHWYRLPILF